MYPYIYFCNISSIACIPVCTSATLHREEKANSRQAYQSNGPEEMCRGGVPVQNNIQVLSPCVSLVVKFKRFLLLTVLHVSLYYGAVQHVSLYLLLPLCTERRPIAGRLISLIALRRCAGGRACLANYSGIYTTDQEVPWFSLVVKFTRLLLLTVIHVSLYYGAV